jgi:predicted nucleic acid-binding protein
VDAFDADVLIYAADPDHPLGSDVRRSLTNRFGVGSVMLVPEVLTGPLRRQAEDEVDGLAALLGRLELLPVDHATAELAAVLGASYRLRAADAVHLATAVLAGAERFITNNRKDFTKDIHEIAVTYPDELLVGDAPE